MPKPLIFTISIFIFCISCHRSTSHIEYISLEPEIVYDSIFTRLPGEIFVKDNYFIWQDAMAKDSFIHVVDIKKRKEIAKIGNIGKGPDEFITPALGNAFPYDLIVYDLNGKRQSFFSLDSLLNGKQPFVNINLSSRNVTTSRLAINETTLISLCPEKLPFLFIDRPGEEIQFGEGLFSEKYSNGFYINQGDIAFNNKKNIFIYAASKFPYMAIYKWKKQRFILEKVVKDEFEHEYTNNKIIVDEKKAGPFSVSLTKNYIVTHRRHYETDNTNEKKVGMDVSKAPSTLFLYDYSGSLLRIVNLKMPIVRITSNIHSDIIFAIAANPDYVLVKCEL